MSLTLLGVGSWLLIRIAANVYNFTLLQSGSRVGWKRLWRLIRNADTLPTRPSNERRA